VLAGDASNIACGFDPQDWDPASTVVLQQVPVIAGNFNSKALAVPGPLINHTLDDRTCMRNECV
jgi:hypothetical protein